MKDVKLEVAGTAPQEIYPRDLPDIHQGEEFAIFGRFRPEDKSKTFSMRLHGHNAGKGLDLTFTRDLSEGIEGTPDIQQKWAFWKLHHLYSEMIRLEDDREVREQIRQLVKDYDLKAVYDE